jgi:hypothetical protein
VLTTLLIAGCLALGEAEAAPAGELPAAVRRLVRQLDADTGQQRDQAEADLIRLGPDVLDLLPDSARQPPEVKHRLGRVRQQLELLLAEQTSKPGLVTLRGDALPLGEVLADLQKQTGNPIQRSEQLPPQAVEAKVNVSFDKTPFWEALDQVLDQAGLTVYPYGEGPALEVVARPENHAPRARGAVYRGPFRIVPLRVIARRELRETHGDSLTLTLEVAWEPRVAPIVLKQPMEALAAVDEKGNPLKAGSPEAEFDVTVNPGQTAAELSVPLELPPREATRIASLKGKLTALLPGKVQTFRFKDLAKAKNVEQRRAGVRVTVQEVRKNNEIWQVAVLLQFDKAGEAFSSHYDWFSRNKAHVEGPDGKPVENAGMEVIRRTETEVGIAYNFDLDKPLEQYTFVYQTPGLLITKEFAYEIKDVKLP